MRVFRSLRAQLAVAAAGLALVVVALSGLVIVVGLDAQDRATLDSDLAETAARIGVDVPKMLLETNGTRPGAPDRTSGDAYGGLLDSSGSLVRLISGGTVLAQRGDVPSARVPTPDGLGLTTVEIDGGPWRSLVVDLAVGQGIRLQVLRDLTPIVRRLEADQRLVLLTTLVATAIAALGGWVIGSVVARPVRRLRDGAREVRRAGQPTQRLPVASSPIEIHDLAITLNSMLAQLQTSMQATRRFTADAGHELRTPLASLGTYIETLESNPRLPPDVAESMVRSMAIEHRRITSLLDGLQSLARGDAGAIPAFVSVDLGAVAAEAAAGARRRYSLARVEVLDRTEGRGLVAAWPDGLRLAIDNLIDNSAVHGRPDGSILIEVTVARDEVTLAVVDDGPGIPVDLKDTITGRFVRGPSTTAAGTGLGLALVTQQATLHGGALALVDAAGGGLRATITLPRSVARSRKTGGSDPAPNAGRQDGIAVP